MLSNLVFAEIEKKCYTSKHTQEYEHRPTNSTYIDGLERTFGHKRVWEQKPIIDV